MSAKLPQRSGPDRERPRAPSGENGAMSVFTMIIDGQIPGTFVWADEVCVAFSTIEPIAAGHVLVVPREEIEQYSDLPDDVAAHLAIVAARIGRAQRVAFDAPRSALLVAGFEVPHTHIHVLPAWGEEHLSFAYAKAAPAEEIRAAAEKLRAQLVADGWEANVPPIDGL